jgi:DNA-binding MarR family transcriptional regulator
MKETKSKDGDFQSITNEYHKYLEALKTKNSEYRKGLADQYCKKIYDELFLEVKSNNKDSFKFSEILKLTKMTKPTLSLHLKHLEEKRFITKKAETKYKTIYRVNLVKVIKVCRIKKTITGKEKLELTDITKVKIGESFIPMEPMKTIKSEENNNPRTLSNTGKARGYFKAHKNKL